MPNYTREMFWIDASRVELDEVAKANKIPVLPPEEI
jgi:hypothetical protein